MKCFCYQYKLERGDYLGLELVETEDGVKEKKSKWPDLNVYNADWSSRW